MDYHPFPWPMLRVWLLLMSVAALFCIRALAAWLRRRRDRLAPTVPSDRHDAVSTPSR